MKIISKIEINYFRSIYSLTLTKNNDINVFVGGNDAGKSNILKALNLFFNNDTELGTFFDFNDDLSRLREKEARSAKGRASVWIKITFNNFLHWKSLPKEFVIKRTWNRYEERPVDAYPQNVPSTTIGRFLNKISFHYIPAVRGRDIFAHYLNALHDSLIDDEKAGVKDASAQLMVSINKSTGDMSERIKSGIGLDSNIQVPKDLRELFSALDFSTKFSGYDVPLQKRGDGIQARHIPFILDFIARHSSKHHIWAYEEPENSLELSRAFELAGQFEKDFSKANQIYLTTHSPAFYDMSGTHVSRWSVRSLSTSAPGNEVEEFVTHADSMSGGEIADESLGIAALIANRAKELYQQINSLNAIKIELDAKIANAERTQVVVEGKTDKTILEVAFSKLFPREQPFCEFISAEGANNVTNVLMGYKTLAKHRLFSIVGLWDNDHKGRAEAKHFKTHKHVEGHSFREISAERRLYCGLLPIAQELTELAVEVRDKYAPDFEVPLTIEYMFPHFVVNRAIEEGILVLRARETVAKDSELSMPINLSEALSNKLPMEYRYLAYAIDDTSKNSFSAWVKQLPVEDFSYFSTLFATLQHLSI